MIEKVVLIGAGSAVFTRGLVADLARTDAEIELVLVDIDERALAAVEALTRKMIAAWSAKIRLSAHSDRRDALTGANMIGLCHGVWHTAGFLAGHLGVDAARLTYSAVGMNHLTWFTDIRIDGKDATGHLREIAAERMNGDSDDVFSWQLLHLFGGFPAPLDRHVTEFFPQFYAQGGYNGKTLGVDAFSFEECIALGDRIYSEMEEAAFSDAPLSEEYLSRQSGEHEQVTDIIDSIRTNAGRVYSANLPNTGQVANLPVDSIVESPCIAVSSGLHPITQPPLPSGMAAVLATRMMWVELAVEAALEGSRDKFVQALVVDGAVSSIRMAEELADELLLAQAQYLPQFAQYTCSETCHSETQ